MTDLKPRFAWQQMTVSVAAALSMPIVWHESLDEYSERDTGAAFDPVRDVGHAMHIAKRRGIRANWGAGVAMASFEHDGAAVLTVEYDHFNDGNPDKSFCLAVCRAVLRQSKIMLAMVE